MPTIKERLSEIIKTSMKARDQATLLYARNLKDAIGKKELADNSVIDDAAILKIVVTVAKQRNESIDQFRKGGREDLVANEEAELKFLQSFLPAQMSEDEVRKIVDESVTEAKATSAKDMGTVMKILMPKVQGRADGKLINQLVKERLG